MSLNRLKDVGVPLGLNIKLYDFPIKHTCVHSDCISDVMFDTALNAVKRVKSQRKLISVKRRTKTRK